MLRTPVNKKIKGDKKPRNSINRAAKEAKQKYTTERCEKEFLGIRENKG